MIEEVQRKKREIIQQIGDLQKKHKSGECRNPDCSVCIRIRYLGTLLEETSKVPIVLKRGSRLTKEDYIFLKQKAVPDRIIARHMKIGNGALYELKKEWGIKNNYRGGS